MKKATKFSGLSSWYNSRKQKSKEKQEQQRLSEPTLLKILTFSVTLIAMALAMSFLPLFPQPLPILLAVLVAFVTFRDPRFGMPVGGAIIGLGLMYHLAELYFFSFLGDTPVRIAILVVWMALFVALPIIFHRYKSALAIDFGILAVTMLFSTSTYFLAIPLILASAVFFKKHVSLTIVYYVLLSVPLQIVQYFTYTVAVITRTDWWVEPGSSPPLFVPLNHIFADLGLSMSQFRLYDTSKIIYDIAGQLTWVPNYGGRTLTAAFSQYLDSIPGILMFVVIVAGLSLALVFLARLWCHKVVGRLPIRLIPSFMATCAAAFFFIFLGTLQRGLAFTATVSASTIVFGTLATFLFTFPTAFIDYTPKQIYTIAEITEKAQALLGKLQVFEDQLNNVKENIPVIVSSPEGKMLVIKDSLEDMLRKFAMRLYEMSELNQKFEELEKMDKDIDDLEIELNTILSEYQIFANCEFSNWMGKLKDSGLDIKSAVNADYQKEMSLEARTEAIKQVLNGGRVLAKDVVKVAEPVYGVIRALYDPTLPEKSRAIEFTMQKLGEKEAPWIAVEALFTSLNNWKKQYGSEILASIKYLKSSLTPIANLSDESEVLAMIFGENLPKILDHARKAEAMKATADKKTEKDRLNILDVVTLKDDIQSVLNISKDVLSMLYSELINEEKTIEHLLPTGDYLWEKNSTLPDRLKKATEVLANPSKYQINQIMENLPIYLSYVDETMQTLAIYKERKEFLLNYPTAEAAIEEQLRKKKLLSPQDLPFQTKFAGEYLRLYYIQRFSEFAFDKENLLLTKRT